MVPPIEMLGGVMNREQLIRAIRKLARKRGVHFELDEKKGKGSHCRVEYGDRWTTVQHDLNPGRILRILRQLDIHPDDL
jgi:hypothetical protein